MNDTTFIIFSIVFFPFITFLVLVIWITTNGLKNFRDNIKGFIFPKRPGQ